MLLATAVASTLWYRLGNVVTIATFVPFCAVSARRLHDTNRSGWWQLIGFVPLVGWIVMIVWCIQDPVEPNRFG